MNKNKLIYDDKKQYLIYLCGPTVYDYSHIGNMRPVIVFDLIIRYLRYKGINFFYVHNITDIDDKIINRAREQEISEKELTTKFINEYNDELRKLNIIMPNKMPKVSENITNIKEDINELIEKEYAYESKGNVFFNTKKIKEYGEVSNQKIDQLVLVDESADIKKDGADFSLWKRTKEGISFKSKWGEGRPGWHTECYSMIKNQFGNKMIDLHGGGSDLKFPHHENEQAQWQANFKGFITKTWIHIGQLHYQNKKMSKTLGNLIYTKDFLETYSSNHIRYLFYSSNYAQPISVDKEYIQFIDKEIKKIVNFIFKIITEFKDLNIHEYTLSDALEKKYEYDLNTTQFLHELNKLEKQLSKKMDREGAQSFLSLLSFLGFNFNWKIDYNLINRYKKEKSDRNYKQSDIYRDKIIEKIIGKRT